MNGRSPLPTHLAHAIRNIGAWSMALPVLSELHRHDIPCIVLKSLPQVEELYGSAGGRVSGDVDLVVRGEDADDVLAIARSLGWGFKFPARYTVLRDRLGARQAAALGPWPLLPEKSGHTGEIDLHTDSMPAGRYPPLDASIWRRARPSSRDGVRFLTLAPEDRLLFLCWHALVEGLPAHKLVDVEYILRDGAALDWSYLAERATSSGTTGFLHLACEYVLSRATQPLRPFWREQVPLSARTRFHLLWLTIKGSTNGIGRGRMLVLYLMGHDRLATMLPHWRLALLPSRLDVAVRTGVWPSRHGYWLELVRIQRKRVRAHG